MMIKTVEPKTSAVSRFICPRYRKVPIAVFGSVRISPATTAFQHIPNVDKRPE